MDVCIDILKELINPYLNCLTYLEIKFVMPLLKYPFWKYEKYYFYVIKGYSWYREKSSE